MSETQARRLMRAADPLPAELAASHSDNLEQDWRELLARLQVGAPAPALDARGVDAGGDAGGGDAGGAGAGGGGAGGAGAGRGAAGPSVPSLPARRADQRRRSAPWLVAAAVAALAIAVSAMFASGRSGQVAPAGPAASVSAAQSRVSASAAQSAAQAQAASASSAAARTSAARQQGQQGAAVAAACSHDLTIALTGMITAYRGSGGDTASALAWLRGQVASGSSAYDRDAAAFHDWVAAGHRAGSAAIEAEVGRACVE